MNKNNRENNENKESDYLDLRELIELAADENTDNEPFFTDEDGKESMYDIDVIKSESEIIGDEEVPVISARDLLKEVATLNEEDIKAAEKKKAEEAALRKKKNEITDNGIDPDFGDFDYDYDDNADIKAFEAMPVPEKTSEKAFGVAEILDSTKIREKEAALSEPVKTSEKAFGVTEILDSTKIREKEAALSEPVKTSEKAFGVTEILDSTKIREKEAALSEPVKTSEKAFGVTEILDSTKIHEKEAALSEPVKSSEKAFGVTEILDSTKIREKEAALSEPVKTSEKAFGVTEILDSAKTREKEAALADPVKTSEKAFGVTEILDSTKIREKEADKTEVQTYSADTDEAVKNTPDEDNVVHLNGDILKSIHKTPKKSPSVAIWNAIAEDEKRAAQNIAAAPVKDKTIDSIFERKTGSESVKPPEQSVFADWQSTREQEIEFGIKRDDEIEKTTTIAETVNDRAPAETEVSGDTVGLGGNEISAMKSHSIKDADDNTAVFPVKNLFEEFGEFDDDDDVKEYKPLKEQASDKGENPSPAVSEKQKRSNTSLIENLNKSIASKRESDILTQRTISFPNVEGGGNFGIKAPTVGLNIDYAAQVLRDSGQIPPLKTEDPHITELKLKELESKRKRKINEFVLEDIGDDEDDDIVTPVTDAEAETDEKPRKKRVKKQADTEDDSSYDIADFDDYDGAGQIWTDLCESHKSLKIRFIVLLVIGAFLGIATVLQDIGVSFCPKLFGFELSFLSMRNEGVSPEGFIYMNLIFGVVALALCSSVLVNGIMKLFHGKGDCDSLCAVSALVSLLVCLIHLTNANGLQQGYAYIYVAVSVFSLIANTIGKLTMITRAKRNFRFVAGDGTKYSAYIVENENSVSALTKGVVNELPVLLAVRKTEFLTDFLKSSYCNDKMDKLSAKLTPVAFGIALLFGVIAFFMPYSQEHITNNIYWSSTVFTVTLALFASFGTMFVVNNPLLRAARALDKSNAVLLGYNAAVRYSEVNAVVLDAKSLFPAGSIAFKNIKRCQPPNTLTRIEIDEAIILAASLAIKSGSVLSSMFYDMINGKEEILVKVDGCIYEDNMGSMGWVGNRRMMLGNRDQMKHHGIEVPDIKKEQQYCKNGSEAIYLAVGGETVALFFVLMLGNSRIRHNLKLLQKQGVSIIIKTNDALVTVGKMTDLFELEPEMTRVLPYSLHETADDCLKYVSRSSGALACDGTVTSMARVLTAAKTLMKDINAATAAVLVSIGLAIFLTFVFTMFFVPSLFAPTTIIVYNSAWLVILLLLQGMRKY